MRAFFFGLIFWPLVLAAQEGARFEDRAESEDGLLVVHGGTVALRSALLNQGEEIRQALDELVGAMEGEVVPIVMELHAPREGRGSELRRALLEIPEQPGRYRLQVDLLLGRGMSYDGQAVEEVWLEMMLYERSVRGKAQADFGEAVYVRPWLVAGLREALAWRVGVKDREVYDFLSKTDGWLSVAHLVEQDKAEHDNVLAAEVYRASAGALVMALLAQPKGDESMRHYLAEVALFEGEPMILLRKHFPSINQGSNALEKWWLLKVADLASPSLTEVMSPGESERALEKILRFRYGVKDAEGASEEVRELGLEQDWALLAALERTERGAVLRPMGQALSALSYRCYPGYRSVISGYLGVIAELTKEEVGPVDEILGNLRQFREAEMRRMERLEDLLDWYHLSTVREESGEFREYLKLKKTLREEMREGDDPVSRYVDQVQRVFER